MTDIQYQTINIPSENTTEITNETSTVETQQQNNKIWKNDIQPNEEGIESFSFVGSNEEYRYISQNLDINQWYYDEFSGIYRQNEYGDKPTMMFPTSSSIITGSHSDISISTESNKDSVTTTDSQTSSIHRIDSDHHVNNSNDNNNSNNIPSIDFHHSSSSLSTSSTSSISSYQQHLNYTGKGLSSSTSFIQSNSNKKTNSVIHPFPWPEKIDRIYEWCDFAKKSQDPNAKLKLCQRLLLTLSIEDSERTQEKTKTILQIKKQQRLQQNNNNNNNKYHKKSKSTPMIQQQQQDINLSSSSSPEKNKIRKVMMSECLQLLKKLSGGQSLGKGGDSEAQYILANCYGMGLLGLTQDHSKAFQWYVQASKQSHPEATYRTAVCHELGIGTRKDGQRALVFYRKAAHLTHVGSMYKLGIILLRGYYDTPPMPREAISWLQRAVSHVFNQNNLHHPSSSLIKNESSSNDLLTRPTSMLTSLSNSSSSSSSTNQINNNNNNNNNNNSKNQDHLLNNNNNNNNYSSSSFTLSTSLSSSSTLLINQYQYESTHALHALAMVQLTGEIGDSTNLIADPIYALELLHQAGQMGYIPSQIQLGHCYEHGQWVAMDDALSIYWYARAAEQGNPEGCLALSGWYLTGSTTKGTLIASDKEAYLWAHRAAITMVQANEKWTVAKAHFAVAIFLERGIGVKQDIEKAKKWMLRAAILGHAGAKHNLLSHEEQKEWLKQQNKISTKINNSRKQQQQQKSQHEHKNNPQLENKLEIKNKPTTTPSSSSKSSCIVM
ncbi:unnamed protein product [Cunninghamella blakesleeana]